MLDWFYFPMRSLCIARFYLIHQDKHFSAKGIVSTSLYSPCHHIRHFISFIP